MKLSTSTAEKYFAQFGCWVTRACDGCRRPLGAVSYTLRGDDREWCSPECREGRWCRGCGASLLGMRGDATVCSDTCQKRVRTSQKSLFISESPLILQDLQTPKGGADLRPFSTPKNR